MYSVLKDEQMGLNDSIDAATSHLKQHSVSASIPKLIHVKSGLFLLHEVRVEKNEDDHIYRQLL